MGKLSSFPLYIKAFIRGSGVLNVHRYYSVPSLRDYQQDCITRCIDAISDGNKRIGVSLATGGGKTVIFSNLIDQLRASAARPTHRTLILVHRRELALQAAATLKKFFPLLNVQIEMGKYRGDLVTADVIIASVQSLVRRLDSYPSRSIDLIIIDEAHHAAADSYLHILKHFDADHKDTFIPVVGFSATFERADNKALSRVMDKIVYHRGILEMIDAKWLCEGKFTTVDVNVNLDDVATSGFDFNIQGLSKVMNTPEVNKVVLQTYLQKKKEHGIKSTILFGCDISHIESLFHLFQSYGINAQYVNAKTRQSERDGIVKAFKDGKIEVLMNCGIFTEGTDIPNIDCILLCRPTRSRSLLVQMIGRGLRVHHSKEHCHIVDFIGASRVGVVSIPTLVGIDNYDGELDETTIQDLRQVKQAMLERQQALERHKMEQEEKEKLINQKFNSMVENVSAFDLTLTTFSDFKTFYQSTASAEDNLPLDAMSNSTKEIKLIRESKYPWVRFAKDAWAMPLDSGNHLRIYKGTDKTKEADTYTLKLYRELSYKARDQSGIRYIPREICSHEDLAKVIGSVEAILNDLSKSYSDPSINVFGATKVKNFTKFAMWRSTAATPKQKQTIKTRIKKFLSKKDRTVSGNSTTFNQLTDSDIERYVEGISKGEASNILFALSLAPVFPIHTLIKALSYKKNSNSNTRMFDK